MVKGIKYPKPVEFEFGILSLHSGRFMTTEELTTDARVVLLPKLYAYYNNLNI